MAVTTMAVTLVLGGARSGKSAAAEAIALACPGPVTYIATGSSTDDLGAIDDDMARRIADHQRARNVRFVTLEAGRELVDAVAGCDGPVLVDSLGTWVAATWSAESEAFTPDVDALVTALVERTDTTVVVSDEVGLSVHPESEVGSPVPRHPRHREPGRRRGGRRGVAGRGRPGTAPRPASRS